MKHVGLTFPIVATLLGCAGCPNDGGTWFEDKTIVVGETTRYFRYYVPQGLAGLHPVVFLLHGGTQDMESIFNRNAGGTQEWQSIADDEGFLLIVPNGVNAATGEAWGDDQNWHDCRGDAPAIETGADDVAFISALIDWAQANFAVDTERVYSTGASNGGKMSYRLARELDDRIAAIAAFIANEAAVDECAEPQSPVSAFICNGTGDPLQQWDGGEIPGGRGTSISSLATRDYWIAHNNCDAESADSIMYPDLNPNDGCTVRSELFTGGDEGAEVMFYTVEGGGHTMPSIAHPVAAWILRVLPLGNQNRDIEGARHAWAFLARQRLGVM
jgi:polyhydroxybutyrate depolymerase